MTRPVFVALDVNNRDALDHILPKLGPAVDTYLKIGMELFYQAGNSVVKQLVKRGYHLFLDLKLHDIPNTVYHGAKQLAQLGIEYTTIHALGGSEMIAAAKKGLIAGTLPGKKVPKLLAVTELTSISPEILNFEQNCKLSMTEEVVSLAQTAQRAGADGVICSPLEVANLKKQITGDFLYVTPGIRLSKISDDQKRVATPSAAKKAGASAIVVGRPITKAQDPQTVYETIKKEFN